MYLKEIMFSCMLSIRALLTKLYNHNNHSSNIPIYTPLVWLSWVLLLESALPLGNPADRYVVLNVVLILYLFNALM